MTSRRPGPGYELMRQLDRTWTARVWNGRGLVVEIAMCPNQEQARREAEREIHKMGETKPS